MLQTKGRSVHREPRSGVAISGEVGRPTVPLNRFAGLRRWRPPSTSPGLAVGFRSAEQGRSDNAQAWRAPSRPTRRRPDPLYSSITNGLREARDEDCVSGSWQHGIGDREPTSRRGTSPDGLEPQSGKSRAARARGRAIGESSGSGGRRVRYCHDQPHGRCVDQKYVRRSPARSSPRFVPAQPISV